MKKLLLNLAIFGVMSFIGAKQIIAASIDDCLKYENRNDFSEIIKNGKDDACFDYIKTINCTYGGQYDHNCAYRKIYPLETVGKDYKEVEGLVRKVYNFTKTSDNSSYKVYSEDLGFVLNTMEPLCRVVLFGGVCNKDGTSPYSFYDGIDPKAACKDSKFSECKTVLKDLGINVSQLRYADDKSKYFLLKDCECKETDGEKPADNSNAYDTNDLCKEALAKIDSCKAEVKTYYELSDCECVPQSGSVPSSGEGETVFTIAKEEQSIYERSDAKANCLAKKEETDSCKITSEEKEEADETAEHIEGARTTDNEATTFDQETYALTMAVNYMSEDILKNQNEIEKELEKLQKTMGEEGYIGFLLPMWEKIKSNFAYSSDSF